MPCLCGYNKISKAWKFNFSYVYLYSVGACMCHPLMWRSEDHLKESVLSFHHIG